MFSFDFQEFADAGARRTHEPYNEIPLSLSGGLKFPFQEPIVGITDDIFKEILLLNFDEFQFEVASVYELEIFVDGLEPKVDGLRIKAFCHESLICQKFLFTKYTVF